MKYIKNNETNMVIRVSNDHAKIIVETGKYHYVSKGTAAHSKNIITPPTPNKHYKNR